MLISVGQSKKEEKRSRTTLCWDGRLGPTARHTLPRPFIQICDMGLLGRGYRGADYRTNNNDGGCFTVFDLKLI